MRLQRSLAGTWSFQLDPEGILDEASLHPDRTITVPLPWQAAFPELEQYSGYAWYRRTFDLDEAWLAGDLLLAFGAVDYWCEVYVNGQRVGEHEGGYTPFRLSIRHAVRPGENTLSVRVYDTVQRAITLPRWREDNAPEPTQPPFNAETIPHGKQTWYLDASGIWQDVMLIAVPPQYIERVHITPDIHTGAAQIAVRIGGALQGGTLRASVAGQTAEAHLEAGQSAALLTVSVPQPALWSPESPTLYEAVIQLVVGPDQDAITARFGYREITTHDGYLLLNGQPLYLLCALDQDFYPDTIYTVPSDDFLRDQFRKAKELGLNCLRCHIKVPDPRYLDLADELGLLVWAEIPSWRTFYPKTTVPPSALHLDDAVKQRVRDTLADMIARDYNHPSIIIWTLVNEDWGTALLLSAADRAWVAELFDFCKQHDPTRLVVDNSPCPAPWGLSVHVKSDLDDFHIYTNIPDAAVQFEEFVEQFGQRPLWSFSNTGDARRTGHEPLLVSEFGNWGMPSLKPYAGREPDWFGLTSWWAPFEGEPGHARGVVQRFEQLGLGAIWPDYEAFAEATQWHAFHALKFEIETMRRQPGIQGYVITEFSDIYWESNGLLDFARNPKAFHHRFAAINAPDVIAPHLRRFAYWDDEIAPVGLHVSHYGPGNWSGVAVQAESAGHTLAALPVPALAPGEVADLGAVAWPLPAVQSATEAVLNLYAGADGVALAQNEASVLVLPSAWRQAAYG
ncbi:MAG: glycoside hydrolase family 2, partial [Chloroflexi bacterium]|nr:glycoside hydrolase family 2 [Chloroflexota bacterium]